MECQLVKIELQPMGEKGNANRGATLIEAITGLGVELNIPCGSRHKCGKCKVQVISGDVSSWEAVEEKFITPDERKRGYRLGCSTKLLGDAIVQIPEESNERSLVISKATRGRAISLNPAVKRYYLELDKPSLEDSTDDFSRICHQLETRFDLAPLTIDLSALKTIPAALAESDREITVSVWMDKEIIRIQPGKKDTHYGVAFDVGTTTVAGYLCDLSSGRVLKTVSSKNPQSKFGSDVVSRISYQITNPEGLREMSQMIRECLNSLLEKVIRSDTVASGSGPSREKIFPDLSLDDIEDITIVCNTAMHHILLNINPQCLGESPFTPVMSHGFSVKARDLNITCNPAAYVYTLPNEAGFVGADNVGVLIAEEPYKQEQIHLIIDIGTNGELVLGNRDKLISSSCATGPALEGAEIKFGVQAIKGAIERVRIDPDSLEPDYKIIGRSRWKSYSDANSMKVTGICGSGIIDAVAELYKTGFLKPDGAFSEKSTRSDRMRENPENQQKEYILARKTETANGVDLVITQEDIRKIQLAKAALYSGCMLMMRKLNIQSPDLIKIAGAFGNHIDKNSAMAIGLFPEVKPEKITSVGNAAGDGCIMALLNRDKREEAEKIARAIEFMALNLEADFQAEYINSIRFPVLE